MSEAALQQVRAFEAQVERARQGAITTARVTATAFGAALAFGAVAAVAAGVAGRAPAFAAFAAAALCATFAALLLRHAAAMRRPTELARTGVPATAIFERVVGGGVTLRVSGSAMEGTVAQLRVRLRVEAPGRAPYAVEVADFLPGDAYGRLVPGARFAAHVDPRRPTRVLVDWGARRA